MPPPNPVWTSLSICLLNSVVLFIGPVRKRDWLRHASQAIAFTTFAAAALAVATHFTSFQPEFLQRTRLPGVLTLTFVGAGVLLLLTNRWRDIGVFFGLVATSIAGLFSLGILYGGALIPGVPLPAVSIASAAGGVLTGVGMVTCEGMNARLLRPFAGDSVRAVLLRWLLPASALLMLVTNFTAVRVFAGFSNALGSSVNTLVSLIITAGVISYAASLLAQRLEALAAERSRLESELRQMQKMHTVGQLAGGIAHDFNNLLSVISASGNLALRDLKPDSAAHDEVKEILSAADRGTDLTRQLLMFSRKQVHAPRDVDLNDVVKRITRMLQRLIGGKIEVVVDTSADIGLVRADVGQIEQVLFNLVANARDAMPDGGRLTIRTSSFFADAEFVAAHAEAVTGPYSTLSVSDTGTGMSEDVRRHIFEPFFTTKEAGKGTGLGLATTASIVRQSGGFIDVQTELGAGTTFTVYLPSLSAVERPRTAVEIKGAEDREPPLVLLVEDEAPIRRFARTILQRAGYDVLEADNVSDALEVWSGYHSAICVVVTDIRLPGAVTGWDLADRLKAEDPSLRVVFTSGDEAPQDRELADTQFYLPKPYDAATLLQVVQRSCAHLDGDGQSASS